LQRFHQHFQEIWRRFVEWQQNLACQALPYAHMHEATLAVRHAGVKHGPCSATAKADGLPIGADVDRAGHCGGEARRCTAMSASATRSLDRVLA
jgi:hypothetical protein